MPKNKIIPFWFILALTTMLVACGSNPERASREENGRLPQETEFNQQLSRQDLRQEQAPGHGQLWLGDTEVWLEVAADSTLRSLGLSGRHDLADGAGMVFLYAASRERSFWMKNTWVPLDVAFVGDDMRILRIVSLDPPAPNCSDADMPRAKSLVPARHVVELKKGWFAAHGYGVGTLVRFSPRLEEIAKGIVE